MKSKHILPGFGLTLGTTFLYLTLIILIPVSTLFIKVSQIGFDHIYSILSSPRTLSAFKITVGAAFLSTLINALYGLLMAWVLVRYNFWGRRFIDAIMDIPFAIPTSVAGLTLTSLFSQNGWLGSHLNNLGINIVYTFWGITLAMTFTSIPFVVRSIQPVLEDLDPHLETSAMTLGASPWVIFRKIIFPIIFPAWLTGCAIAFARSLGEFGAVVFIAGNIPMKTEFATLLAFIRLEEYDYIGASVISLALLSISLLVLLASHFIQFIQRRHQKA